MRLDDLDLRELLDVRARGRTPTFANERALILDAVALGLLRQRARRHARRGRRARRPHPLRLRARLAHGRDPPPRLSLGQRGEWRNAGRRLHTLQGMVS